MKTVFLFPGQGAQYPGMAKDLWEESKTVKGLFEIASQVSGKDMKQLLFAGSEDDLKSTDNTQIAMTLANLSAAAVLTDRGYVSDATAGFSVGEYAALVEAGVLSAEDAFKAVLIRGEVMEKGSRKFDGADGSAGMSAVLGLPFESAAPIVASLASKGVYIANHSSPTQIVLAGTAAGLNEAEAALNDAGAMKIVRLKVSGPFHSPLLADARKEFEERTASLGWKNPVKSIVSNVTGEPIVSGTDARRFAGEQIVSTVQWVKTMTWLGGLKPEIVLEIGPGRVLGGLWKSFTKEIKCQPAGTVEAIGSIQTTSAPVDPARQ